MNTIKNEIWRSLGGLRGIVDEQIASQSYVKGQEITKKALKELIDDVFENMITEELIHIYNQGTLKFDQICEAIQEAVEEYVQEVLTEVEDRYSDKSYKVLPGYKLDFVNGVMEALREKMEEEDVA